MATRGSFEASTCATISDNDNKPLTTTTNTIPPSSEDSAQNGASGATNMTQTQKEESRTLENPQAVRLPQENSASPQIEKDTIEMETNAPQNEKMLQDISNENQTPSVGAAAKQEHRESILSVRLPKLKREKSYSGTLERKKKKVKFSNSDCEDDVIVDTHIFDPLVVTPTSPQPVSCTTHEDDAISSMPENGAISTMPIEGAISSTLKKLLRKRSKKRKANIETQTDEKEGEDKKHGAKVRKSGDETGIDVQVAVDADAPPLTRASLESTEGDAEEVECPKSVIGNTVESSKESVSLTQPSEAVTGIACEASRYEVAEETALPPVPYPVASACQAGEAGSHESNECMSIPEIKHEILENSHEILENKHEIEVPDTSCESSHAYNEENKNTLLDNTSEVPKNITEIINNGGDQTDVVSPDRVSIESDSSASSQSSIKREGTFTLDGPSPAKITKSVSDTETEYEVPADHIPSRDSIMESLQFFVTVDSPAPEKTKNAKQVSEVPKAKSSKVSTLPGAKSRTGRINLSLRLPTTKNSAKNSSDKTSPDKTFPDKTSPDKTSPDKTSPVTVLKNNARKTFANVLRTAKKPYEVTDRPTTLESPRLKMATGKPERPLRSSPKLARSEKKAKSVTWDKEPPSQRAPETPIRSREPRKISPRTPPDRTSMLSFRREGTFTKKYDTERDRLQAECNRVGVERDRLQSELHEARTRLEEERTARKALRRSHDLSLRQLREGEARRIEVLMADVRNRLEDEKRESLCQLRDSLTRTHETDLQRVGREREDAHRRQLHEARAAQERLRAEMRRECASRSDHSPAPCCHCNDRDLERRNRDLSTLREHKKRLEEAVLTLQESERQRVGELRRLHEQHEASINRIHRNNKSEAARLLDELRSRERTIGQLERQVTAQSHKIRLQEEKTRGGGSGGSHSNNNNNNKKNKDKDSKDGKNKDKESSTGPSRNNNNNNNSNSSSPQTQQPSAPMSVDVEPSSLDEVGSDQDTAPSRQPSIGRQPSASPKQESAPSQHPTADPSQESATSQQPSIDSQPNASPNQESALSHQPSIESQANQESVLSPQPSESAPESARSRTDTNPMLEITQDADMLSVQLPPVAPPSPFTDKTPLNPPTPPIIDPSPGPSPNIRRPSDSQRQVSESQEIDPSETQPQSLEIDSEHLAMNSEHLETNSENLEMNSEHLETNSEHLEAQSQPLETTTKLSESRMASTVAMAAEIEALKQQVKQQTHQIEQLNHQIESQKQDFENRSREWFQEAEERREEWEVERMELAEHVEERALQVEEQREVVEAQKQVLEEQKLVMEEQQLRIIELAEEVMDQERLAPPPQHTPWHPRRESCVKVCELPTVMEQNSEDETTPTLTPTDPTIPTTFPDLAPLLPPPPPSTLLTPTTPGSHLEPPTWPEVSVDEMSHQYAQLSREHQELQKCYQLLAAVSSSPSAHTDWGSDKRVAEAEEESNRLRMELQEARDHADLLEFRCLELTEEADKGSECGSSSVEKRDQSTSTETEEKEPPTEDLSLPLSIDSGLDLSSDYKKARVSEGRVWLAQLSCAAGVSDNPAAHQLAALLDWFAALPVPPHHASSSAPVSPTLTTPSRGMGVEEMATCTMGRDLVVLATRLQESLADPTTQETVLLDTITKLRVLERSLCGLQERVVSLTDENRELHEAVANLSEAQETRTEASGTESELVHRKTPSLHSDLSDAELSDSPEHLQSRGGKMVTTLDATTSFQESGIFDTSCDLINATTQTDLLGITLQKTGFDLHNTEFDLHNKSECDLQQAEGDLQSAVARLAAIRSAVQGRDLRHLRVQDLQESEEYLRAALEDGQTINLTRAEYESLADTERRLRQELENLKCEKQELECEKQDLVMQCTSLRHHTPPRPLHCGSDAEEAMKGEVRVLRQRLAVAEQAHRDIYEEKCELEEEENDSRLMVQRLESQMEAAREMENLLSASLSQEQEISRELHRRVRDLQILEKDHRGRLEKLNLLKCRAEEKAASFLGDKEVVTQQLVFAVYGLLLADQWRLTIPYTAMVPYTGKQLSLLPERVDVYEKTSVPDMYELKSAPVMSGKQISLSPESVEMFDKTSAPMMMECEESLVQEPEIMTKNIKNQNSRVSISALCDASVQTSPSGDSSVERNEFPKSRGASRSTQDQSTMTPKCVSLSEREQYYLEQIENLQKEKMSLRKGQDNERRDSLQHHHNMEGEIVDVRTQLQEAERDKCRLLFRLEEMQDEKDNIKLNLLQRIEELKGDMSRYNEIFELEKKALQQTHNAQLRESEKERCKLEDRLRQLELQISTFRQELEIVGVAVANDLVDMDADMEIMLSRDSNPGHSQSRQSPARHSEGDSELLDKIRELVKSETSLRQRICELEKKECAYHETIREADKIMSSHVTSYKQRIEDLETSKSQQESKIRQLEASEERLRAAMRSGTRNSDGERISDLLDRLILTENSELKLKEQVWNLERNEKELQIKLMEGEKANQSLRGELRDQEELVHRLMSLETENSALSAELSQAQDSARKVCELQQNESFLRGRVEELEVTENMLKETLHQADLILAQRERKLRDQVTSLQEELQACRGQLEAESLKEDCAREAESAYRKQLEDLRTRLAEAEKELVESSSETISHETQHRSEVTKLRNQLKLCNSQLMELDRLNCELRERVVEAEREGQRYASDLEELSRRHEQDLLTFNLQVSSRDSRVEDLESQVEQMSQSRAEGELDALASTPLPALHAALTTITTAITNCESCSVTQRTALVDVSSQLGTLTELLEGGHNVANMDVTQSDPEEDLSETVENVSQEATPTPPPCPAREVSRDDSSGDDNNNNNNNPNMRRRLRKRLGKERHHHSTAAPSTILEELEEKVREMEEVVGVKEEEVKQREEELRIKEQLIRRKEEDLRLADSEASELNSQLQSRDAALCEKSKEVEQLNMALASLRQQLVNTLEEAERTRLCLQTNHQVNLEALKRKAELITEKVECLSRRGQLKDSIISTLAMQIRAILRSGNMGVIVTQLRCLSKSEESPEAARNHHQGTSALPDFDVDAVCSLLNQPAEAMSS